jgi:hypothetical protein
MLVACSFAGSLVGLSVLFGCSAPRGVPLARTIRGPAGGPLHVDSANPRYFADAAGRVVYLAGSHTWSDLQDYGFTDPPPRFDYEAFLDSLVAYDHNFMRMWRWEQAKWQTETTRDFWFSPQPYVRAGPDVALDGKPKFDLTRFNEVYFERLRQRVEQAGRRGIYVAVMLFNGWSIERKDRGLGDPWRGHPFNRSNNVNGIDGDPDGSGNGLATHTLRVAAVVTLQERYVAKVMETLGDLDNVLYEISNESRPGSAQWQYHMIQFIRQREARGGKRHAVGMTAEFPGGDNQALLAGPADWISPNGRAEEPPVADGRKVILWDTDHVCGLCTDRRAAWRAFTRGANPVFMDPFDSTAPGMDIHLGAGYRPGAAEWVAVRRGIGDTRGYAVRLRLEEMVPRPDLASTGYCLAHVGPGRHEYVVYVPDGGRVTVDLRDVHDSLDVEWFSPLRGEIFPASAVLGGGRHTFSAPFRKDGVLHLTDRHGDQP